MAGLALGLWRSAADQLLNLEAKISSQAWSPLPSSMQSIAGMCSTSVAAAACSAAQQSRGGTLVDTLSQWAGLIVHARPWSVGRLSYRCALFQRK